MLLVDLDVITESPTRERMLHQALDWGTRDFIPADGTQRVDPLQRLLDPTFTERTWDYEFSRLSSPELPGSLHPKQLEALHSPAIHRWLFWGNQVGKTSLGAIDMALQALGRHPLQLSGYLPMPPFTGWASALTWELWEKILLPELLTWLPPWRVLDAPTPYKQSTKRDIVVLADNGRESRITGKAAQQGSGLYQSARVNHIWTDEEHPEAVWNEIQPRLLRYGGRTFNSMTPLLGLTWVFDRIYEPTKTFGAERVERSGIIVPRHWYSHAGLRDNPGITPEARAEMLAELKHNPAQLAARDEGHFVRPEGVVLPWDKEKHLIDITPDYMTLLKLRGAWHGALDLGKWRFAFQFGVANADGEFFLIDEYFEQSGDVDKRAREMHELLRYWKVPYNIMIPADCADPKGIIELNDAFGRIKGGSDYRVYAIDGELKARQAGVNRVESMLNRGALKVRRGMGHDHVWHLRRSASNTGKPMMGSRWMWEITNWLYPKTADGKVQKDDPDDASADGADMMDGLRYLIMQFFPADVPKQPKRNPTQAEMRAEEHRRMREREERAEEERTEHPDDRYGGVLRQ